MITKVNSDKDVEELLDDKGQLKLRTPMNIYIGGQILDRGITIANLIGFYYGRNPQKFQQDTVLQHSRMYGARPKEDLCVTRFYAPRHIYQLMQRIHEFDSALRDAFLSGAHERGVYFIRRDITDRLMPCSPNKLMFSRLTSVRPGRRLLPIGFQAVAVSVGKKNLDQVDQRIRTLLGNLDGDGLIPLDTAVKLLELVYENLVFDEEHEDDRRAHVAALEHLSKQAKDAKFKDQVLLIAASNRDVARMRAEGRFSNAPDTKQQADFAYDKAKSVPVLMNIKGDPRIAFDEAKKMIDSQKSTVDAFVCLEALACKAVASALSGGHASSRLVIAMDPDPETLDWIRKGRIQATIAQRPFTMGFVGLKMLDELNRSHLDSLDRAWAKDPFAPVPSFVDTGVIWIDNQNVDALIRSQ